MTWRRRLVPAVVCVAAVAVPAASKPPQGPTVTLTRVDVDRTFGHGGRLATEVAAALRMIEVLHVRFDRLGRIVLAGNRWVTDGRTVFATLHVARLNTDGSPDPAFGDGGVVTLPVHGVPQAFDVDAANRVTITGELRDDSGGLVGAARLTEDGTPDEEFSSDGFAEIAGFPLDGEVVASAVGEDGVIVLAERTGTDFSLLRLTAAGELDGTFGVGGSVALGSEAVAGVVPDGRGGVVVVFGTWYPVPRQLLVTDTLVRRIAADGTPDLAFGTDGELRWSEEWFARVRPSSVRVDEQGRLVVLEPGYDGMRVGRFLADGTLDLSFSEDGVMPVLVGVPHARSVRSYHLRVALGPEDRWAVFGGLDLPGGAEGLFAEFFSPSDPLSLAAHVVRQAAARPTGTDLFDVDVSSDGSTAVVVGVWNPPGGSRSTEPFVARIDLVGGERVPLPHLEAQWRAVRVRSGSGPLAVRGTVRIVNRGPVRSPAGYLQFEAAGTDPNGELVFRGMLVGTTARRRVRALAPGASTLLRYRAEDVSGPPTGPYALRLAAVLVPSGLQGAPEEVVLTPPLGDLQAR